LKAFLREAVSLFRRFAVATDVAVLSISIAGRLGPLAGRRLGEFHQLGQAKLGLTARGGRGLEDELEAALVSRSE